MSLLPLPAQGLFLSNTWPSAGPSRRPLLVAPCRPWGVRDHGASGKRVFNAEGPFRRPFCQGNPHAWAAASLHGPRPVPWPQDRAGATDPFPGHWARRNPLTRAGQRLVDGCPALERAGAAAASCRGGWPAVGHGVVERLPSRIVVAPTPWPIAAQGPAGPEPSEARSEAPSEDRSRSPIARMPPGSTTKPAWATIATVSGGAEREMLHPESSRRSRARADRTKAPITSTRWGSAG